MVEAYQSGGSVEEIMLRLLQQPSEPTPNENASAPVSMPDNIGSSCLSVNEDVEDTTEAVERDIEMEDELTHGLTGDVLSDYDIEITKEGEAINEYLAMLDSTAASSSQWKKNQDIKRITINAGSKYYV